MYDWFLWSFKPSLWPCIWTQQSYLLTGHWLTIINTLVDLPSNKFGCINIVSLVDKGLNKKKQSPTSDMLASLSPWPQIAKQFLFMTLTHGDTQPYQVYFTKASVAQIIKIKLIYIKTEHSLWLWPWTQPSNLFTRHSDFSWCMIKVSSLATVEKINSRNGPYVDYMS